MKHLSNIQLLEKVKNLVQQERHIQVEFLNHLLEVETRKLFLEIGYGSLFDYVTKELGYSESAAYRRIQAMRLVKSVPEVQHKISSGEITLTTAAQVQGFIRAETKREGNVSIECKRDLVAAVENKSTREVEKILISQSPHAALPSERVRTITETHLEIRLVIEEKLQGKLDQLKALLSHKNHDMNYAELIELLADRELKRSNSDRGKCGSVATPAPKLKTLPVAEAEVYAKQKKGIKRGRYIPARVRHTVWKRDQGCCTFISDDGKKCGSKYQIQFDHIQLYSKGGSHSQENLRLLCAQHNRRRLS
ncbi:HNH endonuclease [Bdellovibrio sp. HCB185ZH]|uniref:HNH endonuclease n=1 Tax=Bdellovibrio sp. HCB185ZH TaxID=3394235 RepID=UPI0039A68DF7